MTHSFGKLLALSLVVTTSFSLVASAANDDNDKPVRKLQKEPATIVVDSSDSTTYYLQSKKLTKAEKKKLKEEQQRLKKEKEAKERYEAMYKKQCLEKGIPYLTPEERAAKKARQKAELDSLLAVDYTLLPPEPEAKPLVWVDDTISETIEQLKPFFNITDNQVVPKSAQFGQKTDEQFMYFDVENGKATKLHYRSQYFRDDPLYIQSVKFYVNGFPYELQPEKVETGKSGKYYWETVDEVLDTDKEKDIAYALAHGDWSRLIYKGKEFKHKIKFTDDKIKEFYNTLTLYRLMGGTF